MGSAAAVDTANTLLSFLTGLVGLLTALQAYGGLRKKIAFRVQLDAPVVPHEARGLVKLSLLQDGQELPHVSQVLLRVENTSLFDIERGDFQERLGFTFPGRTVVGVSVTEGASRERVGRELNFSGDQLWLPEMQLNRRDHIKLLVLVTGEGNEVEARGHIAGGTVVRDNRRRDSRRRWPLAVGACLVVLSVVALFVPGLGRGRTAEAAGPCAAGRLEITGSSAFSQVAEELAEEYRAACPKAQVEIEPTGSLDGLRGLEELGGSDADPSGRISVSDGPAASGFHLNGHPVGVAIFSVVVNQGTGVHDLTLDQIRGVYSGKWTNWNQLGGNNQRISVVSRGSESGTRRVFENKVLGGVEPAVSSDDCDRRDRSPRAAVLRCERGGTGELLTEINGNPGAVGYTEMSSAHRYPDVSPVQIEGRDPAIEPIRQGAYPYWTVEYFYTYGTPEEDSRAGAFLAWTNTDTAKNILRSYGYVPCVDRDTDLTESLCRPESEKPDPGQKAQGEE
ncbi:substrate-binding domain-containing protein [Streptomyces thermolineatus]|uniref:Substrate-binding domain-containing protein n=1 Tax=Streptomyces thermolineatus TaxID=44033 RepID=A0ABN3LRJ3_9ACTN